MLGTVQFGLNYGIANKEGQPSYETARDIIACAWEGGVNCLDTAAIYGSSEEVLGNVLRELNLAGKMIVASKVCHMADDLSASHADAVVEESVTQSLERLGLDSLPICLFHTEDNFIRYAESLLKLKERGLVRCVGSSVNTPGATRDIVRSGGAEAIQLPTSVLDHRFIRQGIIDDAAARGIGLFVRSIYLQGLILMPEEEIMPELSDVIPVQRGLQKLARAAGMGPAEMAARYVLGIPGVTSVVVGVDTVAQMRENVNLLAKGPLEPSLSDAVSAAVPDLPESILFPGKWSKKMASPKLK
jgi:aryl-alcohol dehydrogenase-like predicted oxidoreductase